MVNAPGRPKLNKYFHTFRQIIKAGFQCNFGKVSQDFALPGHISSEMDKTGTKTYRNPAPPDDCLAGRFGEKSPLPSTV